MMTNLFSVFDPMSSILNLPLNWLASLLGLFIMPFLFWMMPSRWSMMWSFVMYTLHKEFKLLLGPSFLGVSLIFISLFSLILFNNFLGLLPYIFTSSSHMALTLSLALPLWLAFMIFGWLNNTQHMFSHLVPQGTPPLLMPFMVLIESISNLIRPGTLAIRLAANMIAGHLLLTLLGNTGSSLSLSLLYFLILAQILLLTLEAAVAIIQSYVFAILSTLYASEVN
uniref:ATP synthase F0 subunit 6 n=1 Tax=Paranaspides williamsi TaxID=2231316 RepID=UPI002A7F1093|nr:ATP synthase F0 subunit 6 [Paranaspides williamsi]WOR81139.1 ATP synthase F0 subunit 6 [Paranaspides williamsi]